MTFSKQKLSILRPQKSAALSTFLIALLMAVALFLPYIILDDGYFLFYGDFNVQQIPFYQHCHEMVRSGSIGWDFGTDLGVNFFGSYTFYLLGSPFFWITLLFPNSAVPYLLGPLLILKFACCALTAYLYLSRFLRSNENARLGAILYAFSGFSVYNIFFNHFHEAIIIFPLLLLSVELLTTENRRGVFALTVCLAAVTNYFFFFGMVVFTVIYWLVRALSGSIKVTVGRFFVLLFEAVLGVLMAAAVLLPTLYELLGNSRLEEWLIGWDILLYGRPQIYANILQCFFFPPDLPARPVFFPGANVKWSSLGGWLPIFSMVGVFAWFQGKKGHWLRRVIGIMVFMALVPILNCSFYMFNSSYYARWYYMPILMMCLATCMAAEDRQVDWRSAWRWVAGITVAAAAAIGFLPSKRDEDGSITDWGLFTDDSANVYRDRFFISCAIAIISLLILRVLMGSMRKNPKFFTRTATVCVCIMSVVYASVFVGLGKTHGYSVDKVMIPSLLENTVILPGDSDDFRVDCYECVDNTGMYLGFSSMNAFHSVVPPSVTEFYEFIGEERGVASRPTAESYAARSLLSVKYLFDLQDEKNFLSDGIYQMPGYSFFDTQSGYDIYKNENYIPYGFTYDYYMTENEALYFGENYAPNMMLKAVLLEDGELYKYRDILKPLASDYSFEREDGKQIIRVSDEAYAADCAARAAVSAYDFSTDKVGFSARISLSKEKLVFFSIPYAEGWTAYIDGESAEIIKANVGFMAVRVPAGNCEIRFEYKTPGLITGLLATLGSAVLFVIYVIVAAVFKKRIPEKERYPEGDELIEKWRSYDTADALAAVAEDANAADPEEDDILSDDFSFPSDRFPGGFVISQDAFSEENVDTERKTD